MIRADFKVVETTQFEKLLRELAAVAKKDFPELLKQTARTFARELGNLTAPQGMGSAARRRGLATMRGDIAKVYVTPSEIWEKLRTGVRIRSGSKATPEQIANAAYLAILKGDAAAAQSIMGGANVSQIQQWERIAIGPFDGGAAHRARRHGTTGRVKAKTPALILTNTRGLNAYIKKQERKVGAAKGAWGDCAAQLGSSRGFPAWALKAGRGRGRVQKLGRGVDITYRLTAATAYQSRLLQASDEREAGYIAAGKMTKFARIAIAHINSKHR